MSLQTPNTETILVHGTFLRDLSFENPHMPYKMQKNFQPNIEISYGIAVNPLQENFYDVSLSTTISTTLNNESLFLVEINYAGVFNIISPDATELEKALYVKCPQVLQPYVRTLVSGLVLDGGLPPLLLQPVDFLSLYLEKKTSDKVALGSDANNNSGSIN